MARRKKRIRYKKILGMVAFLIALPLSVKLVILSMPYMNAAASKAALLSAGLTFPEGGKTVFLEQTSSVAEVSSSPPADTASVSSVVSEIVSSAPDVTTSEIVVSAAEVAAANRGKIVRQLYNGGWSGDLINLSHGGVRNSTQIATSTVKAELAKKLEMKLTKTTQPQVLIYHTHATESYEPITRDYYDKTYNSRSTDNTRNMIMVGNQIAEQLKAAGIGVIHDTTQHDNPSYTGSYALSKKTIQKYMKQYPTIKVVLDVHRDAIQRSDGTRIAPTVKINGKNAAQIMIIAGAEKTGDITHDFYKNLRFAAALQNQMEADNPGLMRPISFAYRKYNQDTSPGALLLEMGGHGNSLEEARYSGELAGKSIAKALLAMMS